MDAAPAAVATCPDAAAADNDDAAAADDDDDADAAAPWTRLLLPWMLLPQVWRTCFPRHAAQLPLPPPPRSSALGSLGRAATGGGTWCAHARRPASRMPEMKAPATVAGCDRHVASPAQRSVVSHSGSARVS